MLEELPFIAKDVTSIDTGTELPILLGADDVHSRAHPGTLRIHVYARANLECKVCI